MLDNHTVLALGAGCVGALVGAAFGMAWGVRLTSKVCEDAVMQDHRVSMLRKAAIVARIRGCPVEWVIEEFDALRATSAAQEDEK